MNWKNAVGVGYSTPEGETCFLSGYNGTGRQQPYGAPVCWHIPSSDGITFNTPASAGFQNFSVFAGILKDTCGTAEYTHTIVAYGKVNARTYGIASTFIPGAGLVLVDGRDYVAYGSAGMFAGSSAVQQPISVTAFATNATADTSMKVVFVKAL